MAGEPPVACVGGVSKTSHFAPTVSAPAQRAQTQARQPSTSHPAHARAAASAPKLTGAHSSSSAAPSSSALLAVAGTANRAVPVTHGSSLRTSSTNSDRAALAAASTVVRNNKPPGEIDAPELRSGAQPEPHDFLNTASAELCCSGAHRRRHSAPKPVGTSSFTSSTRADFAQHRQRGHEYFCHTSFAAQELID